MCSCKCLPCICLPGPGCRPNTSAGQAVVSGLLVHRFRLRCGVPSSCVCQRQFGLIYRPLTHSALDPTCWNGYSMCWWWIHLGGSQLMGVRCGPAHELQELWGTHIADSVERKCFQKMCFQAEEAFALAKLQKLYLVLFVYFSYISSV